jgi:hypothetical protein
VIASLDLARFPLGVAEWEALALRRAGRRSEATFARLLLPMRLETMPLPLPRMTLAYWFGLWPDERALARFRAGPLNRWDGARERLSLTLRPVQSFGAWGGEDPLAGERSEPAAGPVVLLTHSRTRAASLRRFLVTDRAVVGELRRAEGRLWSDGFVDDGAWFPESWFGRFAIEAAAGSWRGLPKL